MPVKATRKQKPEDMLLRVIRVAEILVKGQDETPGGSTIVDRKPAMVQTDASAVRVQKTQT